MVLSALTIATTTGTSGLLASNSIIQRTANRYAECRLKATRQLRKKQRKALSAVVDSRPSAIHRTLSGLMLEQKYIRHYWRPYWWRGVLIIGCLASYQASQMMIAYLVKVVIDGATGISTLSLLPLLGTSLIIAYPVGLWMSVKAEQLIARVQSGISAQVRMDLFDKLQTLSSDFMQKMRPGDIAARFINDVDEFVEAISYNFIYAVFRLFAMMLVCAQLWFIEWHLTVLVLGVLPIAIMLYNHFRPKAVEAVYRFHEAEGDVNHQVQENLRIQSMIKSFDAEATFSRQFNTKLDTLTNRQYDALWNKSRLRVTGAQSLFLGEAMVIASGTMMVLHQVMTPGSLVAFLALWSIGKSNFSGTAQYDIPDMLSAIGAGQRLDDILSQPASLQDAPAAYPLPSFRTAIRFERVSFNYHNRQTSLDEANLTIRAGEHVAIIGANGAGKSTLLNLLMRFYDPSAGQITFDGHNIRHVTRSSLHRQMSIVFQDPMLFDGTLADNIAISRPDATQEEIMRAAQQAQIHDFITDLPAGYGTRVGDAGKALSGGQRQKVAIARALLRNPAILILDEITNGLDASSQAGLMQTIRHVVNDRTVITITHHAAQADCADRILLLQGGRLVESPKQDAQRSLITG